MARIALIGGSGFDDPGILEDIKEIKIGTPYGPLSSDISLGKINSVEIAVINRHGKRHRIAPALVNYRANIWALKELGITHIIATTACGSLREEIQPGHIVFPDQFIDWTKSRKSSFFEGDQVAHISMAEPFCNNLRRTLMQVASELGIVHHGNATVITIEGPRFSTRAESRMFRTLGADIVNMSTVPEVVLAREAGICYASIAMSTDYDSWHVSEAPVTWDMIVKTMNQNVESVKKIFFSSISKIGEEKCDCRTAIESALV
ncbi:MAG: S-methyl-5'-thioadenosine phosphorylase [Syntrophaceae bacterium]|nr:S-methyl-5'-thioadenosine phosphorylase [Syntrophaceae bacterium]